MVSLYSGRRRGPTHVHIDGQIPHPFVFPNDGGLEERGALPTLQEFVQLLHIRLILLRLGFVEDDVQLARANH